MKNKYTSQLIITALAAALFLPLANVLVFRGLGLLFLSEPMTFPSLLAQIFAFVFELFNGFVSVLPVLCITYAFLAKVHRVAVSLVCCGSVIFVYAVRLLEDMLINGAPMNIVALLSAGFECLIVIAIYGLIMLAAFITRTLSKKAPHEIELFSVKGLYSRGAVISILIAGMISAAQLVPETYNLVKYIGAPGSISDVLELATPYIFIVIGAFAAYIVGCTSIKRLERLQKSQKRRK